MKVRCVLCTRFFRPGVALASAPDLASAAAAAAGARAGCAGAEEVVVDPGAGAKGFGTSPPVPGGAKGVTARRKVRAVAWILPIATKTSPCGQTCTGASSQTPVPRCHSVKGQVLVPRVFRRVRPPPHHLIVAAELNLRRPQCSLSLHQGLVAEA